MSEETTDRPPEQQRDIFTLVAVPVFICLVAAAAHGFFEYGARLQRSDLAGRSMERLVLVALYVAPGLFCGVMWKRWGFIFGAAVGVAVRLLTLFNLGMIVPYFDSQMAGTSMKAGWQQLPAFSSIALYSGGLGAVCALVGQVLTRVEVLKVRWFRWLNRAGLLCLTVGIVLAAGTWMFAFMPFGGSDRPRRIRGMLDGFKGMWDTMSLPVTALVWAGLALVLVCTVVLTVALVRSLAHRTPRAEPTPEPDAEEGAHEEGSARQ